MAGELKPVGHVSSARYLLWSTAVGPFPDSLLVPSLEAILRVSTHPCRVHRFLHRLQSGLLIRRTTSSRSPGSLPVPCAPTGGPGSTSFLRSTGARSPCVQTDSTRPARWVGLKLTCRWSRLIVGCKLPPTPVPAHWARERALRLLQGTKVH